MLLKSENEAKYENMAKDERAPVSDHTRNVFIRDEKRAAMSQNDLGLLNKENSKGPSLFGVQYRDFLLFYLILSAFFDIISLSVCLFDGIKVTAACNLVSAIVHITGFTALLLENRMLLMASLVSLTMYFVLNTVYTGHEMLGMWSPSFCSDLISFVQYFSYQQCQSNLGSLRVMGSIVLTGTVVCEASTLHMLRKVFEHEEMIENPRQACLNTTSMSIF